MHETGIEVYIDNSSHYDLNGMHVLPITSVFALILIQ